MVSNYCFSLLFSVVKPSDSFTVLPDAFSELSGFRYVFSSTVLPSILPLPIILTAISPCVHTFPMLLVFLVLTLVLPSVLPGVDTKPIHVVVLPVSFILPSIIPGVGATTVDSILFPFAGVLRSILPRICSLTIFLSFLVLSLVL